MAANHKPSSAAIEASADMRSIDADEPTKAEILEDLRQGLKEALEGKGRPAREALAELRRKLADNADPS